MPDTIERAPDAFNAAAHLLALNAARAGKPAYVDEHQSLSYGELATRVRRASAALRAAGLRREERVLLLMHDGIDWPVAFLACLHAGIVPVAVNTLLPARDYAWMLGHSGARAVLTSASLLATLRAALAEAGPRPVWVAGPALPPLERDEHDFAALHAGTAEAEAVASHRDDIAFWLYSSGSTGTPKAAVHTHGNLFATQATYGRHVLGLREDDITFSAAKLFFAYGLGNSLTFPLSVGATVLLLGARPTPEAVWATLRRHRPTVFFGVPTLYAGLLACPDAPPREALDLRLCVSAGEALPRELGERFSSRYGAPILDGIGSTEMLHIFLSNAVGALRYGSSGRAVPGYELRIVDEDGQPCPPDAVGELLVRGESAALMYWTNRARTRATFLGDWLRTGDKYSVDGDGWYTCAGRADDMLKVSGQYLSPLEIESCLLMHEAVLEAAVIGTVDADGLTRCKAFAVLKVPERAGSGLYEELRAFLKHRLAPHKVPRDLEFLTELPKTPTGKIQRFRLRERERAASAP